MKSRIVSLFLGLILVSMLATPVFGLSNPASKTLVEVKIFRNLAETSDMLVVFHWDWDYSDNYTGLPPASDSIMYRFYDTDGITLLQTGSPYVNPTFGSQGYGNNAGSFYFSAADNLTWDAAYKLNIQGLPAFYTSQSILYTLSTTDYTSASTQAENRAALADYILRLCDRFTDYYDVVLKGSSDSGIVLSSYGELFFKGVIPYLQTLCPELFFIQVYIPAVMTVSPYDMSLQEEYTERLTGTDLKVGFERLGAVVGIGGGVTVAFVYFIICIALCVWVSRKQWGIEAGLALSIPIGILLALLFGDAIFTLLMIASLGAAMIISYMLLFKRTG